MFEGEGVVEDLDVGRTVTFHVSRSSEDTLFGKKRELVFEEAFKGGKERVQRQRQMQRGGR